ncbi:hypothetical protein D1007_34574 [Hordeum vulgare]|nr:hypothetical protein D1007_34574 [Hordeum vulgare]
MHPSLLQQRSLDMDAPAPGYGVGVGGIKQGADEEDAAAEERFDPATFLVDYEEDGILGDPNEEQPMFGVYDEARVNNFIGTNEWNLLEEHLVSAMPRSQRNAHPSLVHPMPFITIWRRRVMDLIGGGRYDEAAQIFVDKVVPLKTVVTAYANADKMSEEIAQIERSVGSRTSHRCPKGKQSALWEFALSLSVPVRGLKKHPHVRCLVCSVMEFKGCKMGVDMTKHLQVCPGMTPEAERRYRDALRKGGSKKKRYLGNVVDVCVSKAPKMTPNLPSDPLHMIHQKVKLPHLLHKRNSLFLLRPSSLSPCQCHSKRLPLLQPTLRRLPLLLLRTKMFRRRLLLCKAHPKMLRRRLLLCKAHPKMLRRLLLLCKAHPKMLRRLLLLYNYKAYPKMLRCLLLLCKARSCLLRHPLLQLKTVCLITTVSSMTSISSPSCRSCSSASVQAHVMYSNTWSLIDEHTHGCSVSRLAFNKEHVFFP